MREARHRMQFKHNDTKQATAWFKMSSFHGENKGHSKLLTVK